MYGFITTTLPLTACVRLHRGGDLALGDELHALVDGQGEGRAGPRFGGESANRCRGASRRSAGASRPAAPRSSASSAFSTPALPFSSKSTPPSTCAASVPLG